MGLTEVNRVKIFKGAQCDARQSLVYSRQEYGESTANNFDFRMLTELLLVGRLAAWRGKNCVWTFALAENVC